MEKIHYAVLFSPRHDIELPLFNYISVCALPAEVVLRQGIFTSVTAGPTSF